MQSKEYKHQDIMKAKKQFTAPSVLQEVPLALEEDLLIGVSGNLTIIAGGHDYYEWNMDDDGSYNSSDWSTLSD